MHRIENAHWLSTRVIPLSGLLFFSVLHAPVPTGRESFFTTFMECPKKCLGYNEVLVFPQAPPANDR
jgi:hypothetical protein